MSSRRSGRSWVVSVALGALCVAGCASPAADSISGEGIEVRRSALRATTTYQWSSGLTTMFNYTDGYCFVGNGNYGLNPGDGPATAYMTLDKYNNYVLTGVAKPTKIDWLQIGGGPTHSGSNNAETLISPSNVARLQPLEGFPKDGWPGTADMGPVVLTNVTVNGAIHDVAYVTDTSGMLSAYDAYSGQKLWRFSATGTINNASAPVIDPSRAWIYTVANDGKIHKYAVASGFEACSTTGCAIADASWPQTVTAKPSWEHVKSALTIGTAGGVSYLYVGTSSNNDAGESQGSVTTINLATGAQKVFNALCSKQTGHIGVGGCPVVGAAMWARAGLPFDPVTQRLYFATGNGVNNGYTGKFFDPVAGHWADSLLALKADGSGTGTGPVDSYTPDGSQTWGDWDLGSTNTLILPVNNSATPHLAVQSGKDGHLRIINLDNMSGQGKPGVITPDGALFTMVLPTVAPLVNTNACAEPRCGVTGAIATWTNPADSTVWVFVNSSPNGSNSAGLNALQLVFVNGKPTLVSKWTKTDAGGSGGGVFVANSVLYYADKTTLWALAATTGAPLWSYATNADGNHRTPSVINGVLYFGPRAFGVDGRAFGTGGVASALGSKIGATCVAWDTLNGAQTGPGNVYISGTAPGYPNNNLPLPAPTPASGFAANKSVSAPGLHQHFFHDATTHMPLNGTGNFAAADIIHVSYYLDPKDPPSEVAVQFQNASGNFWYRMYAGTDTGRLGTVHSAGALVAPGQWGVMELSAGTLGLAGSYVKGASFVVDHGTAYFDLVAASHGTYQKWMDDAPPDGAQFGPAPGYAANKMVTGDNEGFDNEGWVWTTSWANGNTNKPLPADGYELCQIAGVTGPWPLSTSPARSIVLDWPFKDIVYAGDSANTTSTWKIHQSGAMPGDQVSTSCVDLGLKALIADGGFTSYTYPMAETQALSGYSTDMATLEGASGASPVSACMLTGLVNGYLDPTQNTLRATIAPFGGTQDLANWGGLGGTLGICYEPGLFGPFGY